MMPSSKDLKRVEIPLPFYHQMAEIARREERTVASVLRELVAFGLEHYRSTWVPGEHQDRFNQAARQALAFAREEALRLDHPYIGTEHLLLGLLRGTDDLAARVLKGLGVDLEVVRRAVEAIIGRGNHPGPTEIEYMPRARKVLALAATEAQKLRYEYIGTEHLLGALVLEGEGIAAGILNTLGVLEKIRVRLLEELSHRQGN